MSGLLRTLCMQLSLPPSYQLAEVSGTSRRLVAHSVCCCALPHLLAGNQCNGAWPDTVLDRYICNGESDGNCSRPEPLDANDRQLSVAALAHNSATPLALTVIVIMVFLPDSSVNALRLNL
jgi:hypothetical protein